ncbi:MAG: hypothetical protein NTY61_00005 [Candidatus Parcubacteria bacterium]|nr:hypothetical protein [Candidatus Parcubacteria bacterium]
MAKQKKVKVERVNRREVSGGQFVFQVIIVFDDRIRLNFVPDFSRFNQGGFYLQYRFSAVDSRTTTPEELRVSRRAYARIMKVAAAIFAENIRDDKGQKIKKNHKGSRS